MVKTIIKTKKKSPAKTNRKSMFQAWFDKDISNLGSFETSLFVTFLKVSQYKRRILVKAFPKKFSKNDITLKS